MPADPLSENPYQAPVAIDSDVPPHDGSKSRHGCATAYLYFMVVVNSLAAIGIAIVLVTARAPIASGWRLLLLGLNVFFAVALLRWKLWGFYGIQTIALIGAAINLWFVGLGAALLGLVGLAVLYGVLQIGGDRSTWSQLE